MENWRCKTASDIDDLLAHTQKIMKRAHILLAVEDPRQETIELDNR